MKFILNEQSLDKKELFRFNPNTLVINFPIIICTVNGQYIKDSGLDSSFEEGTNWQADSYVTNKGEVWLDNRLFTLSDNENKKILIHEFIESMCITYFEFNYEKAHEFATLVEGFIRTLFFSQD